MGNKFAALVGSFGTMWLAEQIGLQPSSVAKWKSSMTLPASEAYQDVALATGLSIAVIAQAVADDKRARRELRHAKRSIKV
jgi:hypothetical protein